MVRHTFRCHPLSLHRLEDRTTPATLVWQGDVNNLWSGGTVGVDTNWIDQSALTQVLPQNGDSLLFPLVAQNRANTNDIAGLSLAKITFGGTDYVVSGNQITLTSLDDGSTSGANQLNFSVDVGAGLTATVSVTSTTLTLGGVLSGAAGVTKDGAGTLRFANSASNTYAGTTLVNNGALELAMTGGAFGVPAALTAGDGTGAPGSAVVREITNQNIADTGDVTVLADGLLDANGQSDTIGKLTVAGGRVATGGGVLTAGDTSFDGTSTFNPTIDGAANGKLTVNGSVALGGALNLTVPNQPTDGSKIVLIDNDGADAIVGTFAGLAEGTSFIQGGKSYQITYKGGDGNDLQLLAGAAAPAITSANSVTFAFNTASPFTIATSGSPTAVITATGALPTGVTFTDNGDGTAKLEGTPTQSGKFPITIKAANGVLPDATQSFTLTVNQAPAITSGGSVTFAFSTASSFTITTTGFPVSAITQTGALPTGVKLTDNGDGTAKLEGTPIQSGQFPITIKAANGVSPDATQSFTLTVTKAPLIGTAASVTFTFNTASSFTVIAQGFPVPTITEIGGLPNGVTFTDNGDGTGKLTGTPSQSGVFPISFKAANGIAPDATQSFTLTVNRPPSFTSAGSVSVPRGQAFSFTVTTVGFPTIASITKGGAFPAGVTFVDNKDGTGTLKGTPTQSGAFNLSFTASNGIQPDAFQFFTLKVSEKLFAVGAGEGLGQVNVYSTSGALRSSFFPYQGFRGGVSVATADVNADGIDDIITGAGPGGGPHVKVFDGANLNVIASFFAYDAGFSGGVFVAGGDINGDGRADIVTGPGAGGGPHVKAFSGQDTSVLRSFFAYSGNFIGGVRVAVGDVDGNAQQDIITGAGAGGGPHVQAFNGASLAVLRSFFAYAPSFTGGVFVAAGDVNGDGKDDIITGAGQGSSPLVQAYSGVDLGLLRSFNAFNPSFTGGVRVAAVDLDGDGTADFITGAGVKGGPHVRALRGTDLAQMANFFAFDVAFIGGVYVG